MGLIERLTHSQKQRLLNTTPGKAPYPRPEALCQDRLRFLSIKAAGISALIILMLMLLTGLVHAQNATEKPQAPEEQSHHNATAHWYEGISAKLELTTLSYQTSNKELKIDAELSLSNSDQSKHAIDFTCSYERDKDVDTYDDSKVASTDIETEFRYRAVGLLHDLVDYSTLFKYKREKNNSDSTDRYEYDIGPAGLTFHAYKSDTITEASLSYLPVYNYFRYYDLGDDSTDSSTERKWKIERSIHHTAMLRFEASLWKDKIELENELNYKYIQGFDDVEDEQDKYILNNEFNLRYNLTPYLSIGYKHELSVDDRRRRTHDQSRTDQTNSLMLTLRWN